jgi:hypothetical protein
VSNDAEEPDLDRRLDQMLHLVEARTDEPVGVTGPHALDVMCALFRRGFERVEAARRCTCGCADQRCELLLVPGGRSAEEIASVVESVSSLVSSGGRLAIDIRELDGPKARLKLCNLLAHRGFRYRTDGFAQQVLIAVKPWPEDL